MTLTPKPSNWLLVPGLVAFIVMGPTMQWACSGSAPRVQLENPSELCATAVALSSAVKAQAAKLGVEPIELARRACDAALLVAQVSEANLVTSSGIAGATSSADPPSMALAGAAGSGG
jgi:hypothetical protein